LFCIWFQCTNCKRYQFNPEHAKVEETTNILVKTLTTFATSPSFSLCLHLLPPHVLQPNATDPLSEAVQKLCTVASLLDSCQFEAFWDEYNSDDLYLDYTADVYGFEDSIRRGIARTVAFCMTKVKRDILEKWVNLSGESFESWVTGQTGWTIDGGVVVIPPNRENVASSGTVKGENLKWDMIRDRLLKHAQF
jgi:translation initiation factor 3 subunit K